jgi:hypothetical protein
MTLPTSLPITLLFNPPLYIFIYATGVLALLSNTLGVDVSCDTGGTCGYDPTKSNRQPVAIADPNLAPYGVAAQTVLTGDLSQCRLSVPTGSIRHPEQVF